MTAQALAAANVTARRCPTWCSTHVGDSLDYCLADDVQLDFGNRGPAFVACHDARTSLTRDALGTTIGLSINGLPFTEFDVDQATAIAHALLAQIATASGYDAIAQLQRKLALEHITNHGGAR